MPHALVQREVAHHGLTALHVVDSMHERKAMLAELADAFVALPGGLGTLEEFFETWTWAQLGVHRKPVGAAGRGHYWQSAGAGCWSMSKPRGSCAARRRSGW